MLKIHTLTLGNYQTNTYIIHDESSSDCAVIDPGYAPEHIMTYLQKNGLHLEAILLTHGHFDHVGGVKTMAAQTNCRVFLRAEENTMPPMFTAGALYSTDEYPDRLAIAGLDIMVLHTPGHTPGSVCLLTQDALFSGDTLFAGSCGRTDLPGGDWATIHASLHKLQNLSGDYRVFPGHGETTTLEVERRFNPYLR